jgi:NAD(P)-dependent dehydrogenase (short-subunit alcohol dehydrogenase family)
MKGLEGRVAIVTGAGRGIGLGIAGALSGEGASVVLAEIDEESGGAAEALLRERSAQTLFRRCDVGDAGSIQECVDATLARFGRIDILVNNAIYAVGEAPLLEHEDSMWDGLIRVGLRGTERFMRACHPHMAGRGGRIINLVSAAGYQGHAGLAAYAAVKEGIRALTKVAAREWGAEGITVNAIAPFGDSDGWRAYARADPEYAARFLAERPIPRVGDCEQDIGAAAVFLAGDGARYVTGQTLAVDGGGAFVA